jgi:hypothetical protein
MRLTSMMMIVGSFLLFSFLLDVYFNYSYILIREILLRGIAIINFMALYSLYVQILGLIGSYGLIPLPTTLKKLKKLLSESDSKKSLEILMNSVPSSDPSYSLYQSKPIRLLLKSKIYLSQLVLWLIYERFHLSSTSTSSSSTSTSWMSALSSIPVPSSPSSSHSPASSPLVSPTGTEGEKEEEKETTMTKKQKEEYNEHLLFLIKLDLFLSSLMIIYPHPFLFLYCYFAYYSYKRVLNTFFNFQWDILIMEALFLSFLLSLFSFSSSEKSFLEILLIWTFKLLFFRLMFGSGMVKGYGYDKSWNQSYNAMSYHFLTQPLPNILGRILAVKGTKEIFQQITIVTLISELVIPLLTMILPNYFTIITWGLFISNIGLQLTIISTGYFGKLIIV